VFAQWCEFIHLPAGKPLQYNTVSFIEAKTIRLLDPMYPIKLSIIN
jgi:hypothetical protein